ncbi:hypothetical protein D3C75_1141500 [compost metagenome]
MSSQIFTGRQPAQTTAGPGEKAKDVGHTRQFIIQHAVIGFTAVNRFQASKGFRMTVDQICQLQQMFSPLLRRGLPPVFKGGVGRQHRLIDLLCTGFSHLYHYLSGCRVIHRQQRALAGNQLAVNQQLALHRIILL